jgi:ubiquinone/menaquinone biosynthesis C-methylase UbiE
VEKTTYPKVHHPVVARLIERIVDRAEALGQGEHRRELLAGLSGRVVEVGAGSGINFRQYPPTVKEVLAVEPEAYLRRLAAEAARSAPVPVSVVDGILEELPVGDASFDAGVASLVLCSVYDVRRALGELWRVIRPAGELRFYEHVRSENHALSLLQRALDRLVWPRVAGGCHLSRDTRAHIEQAGFSVERCRSLTFMPSRSLFLSAPHILGVARRPSSAAAA